MILQSIDIGKTCEKLLLGELLNQLDTQSFNVHRGARGEVPQSFPQLCRTIGIGTADIDALFVLHDFCLALGAMRWKCERLLRPVALVNLDPHDVRDNLSCFFDDDPVVDLNSQSFDLIVIMQTGP